MVTANILAESDLFKVLSPQELETVAGLAQSKQYSSGVRLFRQDQPLSTLYVVQEGSVRLSMDIRIWEREMTLNSVVNTMDAGETFGWPCLVEPNVATFSAETVSRCQLIEIPAAELKGMMDADHTLGYKLMDQLTNLIAERLRATQAAVQRLRAEDLRGRS